MASAAPGRGAVFASVAHLKRSGDLISTSYDEQDMDRLFECLKLILQQWDSTQDDTTVIRIISGDEV